MRNASHDVKIANKFFRKCKKSKSFGIIVREWNCNDEKLRSDCQENIGIQLRAFLFFRLLYKHV